jgi:hypothetical protein
VVARLYARWIDIASRWHFMRARCLHQSLLLHQWLGRERLSRNLQLGVYKNGGELRAHAWVEVGGRVVSDHQHAIRRFTPLRGPGGGAPFWYRLAVGAHPANVAPARAESSCP